MKRDGVRRQAWLALVLAVAVCVVFSPSLRNGFVSIDDPGYVTDNPHLADGLSFAGLRWAFTAVEQGNWHPLTWCAHLLTAQLFGSNAAGVHLASLLFHLLATIALFLFLAQATGRLAPSVFAAALFSLHPLRVESVAWAAELKDPVSGFFFMLTLLAYRRYAARPGIPRYLAVAAASACALMSKPTAVVLPPILLLLDWWPLGRLSAKSGAGSGGHGSLLRLAAEKAPLAALAAGAAALTLHAQGLVGAVRSYEHPWWVRGANAALSLAAYLGKTLWPTGLSFFYPHPGRAISPALVAMAALTLAALCVLAVRLRHSHPSFSAGWLWYLIAVAPVSGLVQAGYQAMADRYTYLPLVGIAIAVAYGLARAAAVRAAPLRAGAVAAGVLACLAVLTQRQISHWHDSRTLYTHALAIDPDNWNAHLGLGELERREGASAEAIANLRRAVELKPDDISARTLLGLTLGEAGRTDEAIAELQTAVRLNRWWADAYLYLGVALLRSGRVDEAETALRRELSLKRQASLAHPYLAFSYLRQGNIAAAARHAAAYLEQHPDAAAAHLLDGMVREASGELPAAMAAYRTTVRLDPSLPGAKEALERLEGGGVR